MIPAPYTCRSAHGLRLLGLLGTQQVPQHWHSQGRLRAAFFSGSIPASGASAFTQPPSQLWDSAAYHDATECTRPSPSPGPQAPVPTAPGGSADRPARQAPVAAPAQGRFGAGAQWRAGTRKVQCMPPGYQPCHRAFRGQHAISAADGHQPEPRLASPSEPPSAVRSRSGMCSRCSYWMGGRGPQAGRQIPSPMLQTAVTVPWQAGSVRLGP
jgi:hypothetical protein